MQVFFRGTVVVLYFISRYFGEAIFVAACLLPIFYGLIVCILLRFAGPGRLIAAKKRAKRMTRKGVISGEMRSAFYRKCIKGTSPDVRAAYLLFSEGKTTLSEFSASLTGSVRIHGAALKGGMVGVGLLSTIVVFLIFTFVGSLEECLTRTAVVAFLATLNGVALHFILYASLISAERAAEDLARIVDGHLLREIGENAPLDMRMERTSSDAADEGTLRGLRALLRDLDREEREGS